MQARETRSQLGWLEKRLGTGGAKTRALYAWSRRLRHRKELALRRGSVAERHKSPRLSIPRDEGYTVVSAGQIPEANEIAETSRRLVDDALRELSVAGDTSARRKTQLLTGLLPDEALTRDSPFIRFALRSDVIQCVSEYLGFVPILASVDVWGSVPSSERNNSQLFHCDWADLRQVKIFIYASEVRIENGPLVVMGASDSAAVRRRIGYRWRGERYRVPDDRMKSLSAVGEGNALLGPAGTVALVDTCQCFHYGSRLTEPGTSRALCAMRFTLPSAFSAPSDPASRAPLHHLATPDMSPVERLVLGTID